jgi:Uncharacterized protein conserved in bacteria
MPGAARALRIEPSHKRVRTYLAGQLVADTLRPVLVWEGPHYPVYYLPAADIRAELVPAGGPSTRPPAARRRSSMSRWRARPPPGPRCAIPSRRWRNCAAWSGWTGTR